MRKYEYVWLDGYKPTQSLRSKVKIDEYADMWSFDGSSNNNWNGYLEDRRPAANADPYRVIRHIVETLIDD
jgi:hypothetical protein|tara:strand:- start:483 stop:695 length:213 start_codon:yes stop_codon:yes gene_type:complete